RCSPPRPGRRIGRRMPERSGLTSSSAERVEHMSSRTWYFSSESVTEGHPDKVSDAVSDAVLDAALTGDPYSRVACETMVTTGVAIVAGEITTESALDIDGLVRSVIAEIGYD